MNNVIQESSIINLNSKFAVQNNGTYNSNVNFNTNGLLLDENNILYSEIQLLNASFPLSMTNINEYNNTLKYNYNGTNFTVTINTGNYNVNQLLNVLKVYIYNLSFTYNSLNGYLSITSTNFLPFTLYASSSMANIIGIGSSDILTSGFVTLPYPVNLLGIQQIKICSIKLVTENEDFGGNTNLFNVVYVNNKQNGIQNFNFTHNRNIIRNREINNIDILLLDENNNYINFRNQNWQITIKLIKYRFLILANRISIYDYLTKHNKKEILDNEEFENNI
jgi:hypothetical protein